MTGSGKTGAVQQRDGIVLPPLYRPPPVTYTDADILVVVPSGPLPVELPAPLAPAGGVGVLMIADYPSSDLGPYREVFVLTAALYGSDLVWFCPLIYVTSDAALAAGREIWGFPKKLAAIEFEQTSGTVRAHIERHGASLAIDGTLTADIDVAALVTPKEPIVNAKRAPSVDGTAGGVELTAVNFEFSPKRARSGTAALESTSTADDPLGELFPSADGCAASVFRADAVLPYGRVLTSPA